MKQLGFSIVLAAVLWTLMFLPLTAPYLNFWWAMTGSALALSVCATLFRPHWYKQVRWDFSNILYGLLLAAGLWAVFWLGDKISSLLFSFARPQVDLIYGMKTGESSWVLSVLMLFLIGPCEEIFWRGYVQHTLSSVWSANKGWVVSTLLYTLVHIGSCNFMLVMAAAVAGCVWGTFYRFFPNRLAALILSHALWDAAVFIWFPI